jgi:RecA/RadA recombinase
METSFVSLLTSEFDRISRLVETPERTRPIPTGFVGWDAITGGLSRGEIHVILGPASSGASSLALTVATNASVLSSASVLHVSRSRADQVTRRVWSIRTLTPIRQLELGHVDERTWGKPEDLFIEFRTAWFQLQDLGVGGTFDLEDLEAFVGAREAGVVVFDDLRGLDLVSVRRIAAGSSTAVVVTGLGDVTEAQVDAEWRNLVDSVTLIEPHLPFESVNRFATVSVVQNRFGPVGSFEAVFLEDCLAWLDAFLPDTPLC